MCLNAIPKRCWTACKNKPEPARFWAAAEDMLAPDCPAGKASGALCLLFTSARHNSPMYLLETPSSRPRHLGAFRVTGMGKDYDVRVRSGGLDALGEMMQARG
jgi:hypothetical protein